MEGKVQKRGGGVKIACARQLPCLLAFCPFVLILILAICTSFYDKYGSSGTVIVRTLFFINLRFEVFPARAGNRSY